MDAAAAATLSPPAADSAVLPRPVWRLGWLTPGVCRLLFAVVLTFGFVSHVRYLNVDCPIDLSGDEAHYWDWSRRLDLSYYSKGPLVAYIIRASTELFGNTMPAVRYPALALGVMTSVVTYLLALRLFRSDRVALGAVLLYHVVPGATITYRQALKAKGARLTTALEGSTVRVKVRHRVFVELVDADRNDRNPFVVQPNLNKGNRQIAHGIDRVLRPVNL